MACALVQLAEPVGNGVADFVRRILLEEQVRRDAVAEFAQVREVESHTL